jgi:hypothetical protein
MALPYFVIVPLAYAWASPASLIGICMGALGLLTGGGYQIRRGALEFHGGAVAWSLSRLWIRARAMTLGHTILGLSPADLDVTRDHEHVHVRQYARWGPFFIPAYFMCSLVLWLRGSDPYFDNPFEVEAFDLYP